MLSLAKRVMVEYQILLMMMGMDINPKLQPTLSTLLDMLLSLVCNIIPVWKQSVV